MSDKWIGHSTRRLAHHENQHQTYRAIYSYEHSIILHEQVATMAEIHTIPLWSAEKETEIAPQAIVINLTATHP